MADLTQVQHVVVYHCLTMPIALDCFPAKQPGVDVLAKLQGKNRLPDFGEGMSRNG